MRAVPQAAIDFVKAHEGLKLTVSGDSVGVPVNDVGYGHVTTLPVGTVINQAQADAFLSADLGGCTIRLGNVLKPDVMVSLTDNQYAALLSFVFNVGVGKWHIWDILNARQFDQVPAELMRFVNAGGHKVQGLVNRRADEVKLWSTDEPGSIPDGLGSSANTRSMPTPPTSKEPTPAARQPKIVASAITVVTTAATAITSVTQTVTPFAGKAHLIDTMLTTLAVAGCAVAVLTSVLMYFSHRQQNR